MRYVAISMACRVNLSRIPDIMENHPARRREIMCDARGSGGDPIGTLRWRFRCTPHIPLPGKIWYIMGMSEFYEKTNGVARAVLRQKQALRNAAWDTVYAAYRSSQADLARRELISRMFGKPPDFLAITREVARSE